MLVNPRVGPRASSKTDQHDHYHCPPLKVPKNSTKTAKFLFTIGDPGHPVKQQVYYANVPPQSPQAQPPP